MYLRKAFEIYHPVLLIYSHKRCLYIVENLLTRVILAKRAKYNNNSLLLLYLLVYSHKYIYKL